MPDEKIPKPRVNRRGFVQTAIGLGIGAAAPNPAVAERRILKPPAAKPVEAHVRVNQVGFLPNEPKRAVIAASGPIPGNKFYVVDDDVVPEVRFTGELTEYEGTGKYGHYKHYYFADFNSLTRPGRYCVRLPDGRLSPPFSIGKNVYTQLVPLMMKYFDTQTCGPSNDKSHPACHVDDGVIVGGPRDGQTIDASGGWHDAGDFLKFVETTSYVAAALLGCYDGFTVAFPPSKSGAGMPHVLRQAKVGVDWLLKMHPSPEEFYYQVGDESDHDFWRLPEEDDLAHRKDWKPRPVFYGVGANLAGRTTAAFAAASKVMKPYDAAYAARCLKAALSVYQLGLKNRVIVTTKPDDYYPEKTWADDMEWAAVWLYRVTGKKEYHRSGARILAHRGGNHRGVEPLRRSRAGALWALPARLS